MKKLYLVNCFLLLFCFSIFGQGIINNHWQLGQTDLNFTNTNPTANVVSNGNYGTASISDSSGNLLFYTNGIKVWNKNHQVMTNGNSLNSALEGVNDIINTIIIPIPGNDQQFYIISSVNVTCTGGGSTCHLNPTVYLYSKVEINSNNLLGIVLVLNPSGYGQFETLYSKKIINQSDNQLYVGPLTYAKSLNNDFYWVIIQNQNTIQSYKLDNNGLNLSPIISQFSNNQIYDLGTLNPNGSITGIEGASFKMTNNNLKLVGLQFSKWSGSGNETDASPDPTSAIFFKNYFYTLDFNSSTGQFSNYQTLTGAGIAVEKFEISQNSNFLYYVRKRHPSAVNSGSTVLDGEIVVKDLTNNATPVRIINEFVNTTTPSSGFSYIQKDRNGNILVSSTFTTNNRNLYVHKIENQDSFANSSINLNFLSLNNHPISILPQVIPELFVPQECVDLTLLNEPYINTYTYNNYLNITTQSNYSINQSTQNISMYASNSIVLKPNTFIATGSKYLAKINPCSSIIYRENENGIIEGNKNDKIKILKLYPNPTDNILNILYNIPINSIEIISIDGKAIIKLKIENKNEFQLDVSNYSKGIYFLIVIDNKGNKIVEKFIKK